MLLTFWQVEPTHLGHMILQLVGCSCLNSYSVILVLIGGLRFSGSVRAHSARSDSTIAPDFLCGMIRYALHSTRQAFLWQTEDAQFRAK